MNLSTLKNLLGLGAQASNLAALDENNNLCREIAQTRLLDDYVYTVLDTELTGLSARREEIVSIGAVRVRGLAIVPGESFSALVRPSIPLPKTSTLIHRITPEAIAKSPPLAEVLPGLIEFCKGTLIVGHHVGLDMSFINRACKKNHGQPMTNPCLDTMRMAMLWREKRTPSHYEQYNLSISYVLTDLAREFDLPRFTAHEALGDALQTAYLFIYLAKKIAGNRPLTLRELFRAGQSWRWYM
ncbi:MAG: 3'-5' exonuclease [Desulfomicrobium sp.]|nr:3'-5' exonuclease [Pseudomonadota bacterium]MBV1711712.1 3'-5' exonuclease [Desulfomicrobium sp.]MBU4572700.1 3'-5' exonuclease [Pseudomonadota bacterium]MBU4593519.1 3'-5' exonuclease [Pseudomonadota bacterium]MBV1720441.1 3'-5' exonuclease [Desulfomicrobium sp.]